jgi:plasmid stabilization system protein ParE
MSSCAFHPEAVADLDEIWEYIAEDNIDAADGVLADIYSTLTTLAASPNIGHRRPDLTASALRFHSLFRATQIAFHDSGEGDTRLGAELNPVALLRSAPIRVLPLLASVPRRKCRQSEVGRAVRRPVERVAADFGLHAARERVCAACVGAA